LHAEKIYGVAVGHGHHFDCVEVFEEGYAERGIAEVDMPVDANHGILQLIYDHFA
jgi:hypothetical protein